MRLAGARPADWKDHFLAIYRRKIKSAIFTFEPAPAGDAVADLSAKLQAYETALTPVMTEYVGGLGRSTAIRTLDAHTRMTAGTESRGAAEDGRRHPVAGRRPSPGSRESYW